MFTDRKASHTLNPTELDWIVGIALRWRNTELALYREEDRPFNQSSLIQNIWRFSSGSRSTCRSAL